MYHVLGNLGAFCVLYVTIADIQCNIGLIVVGETCHVYVLLVHIVCENVHEHCRLLFCRYIKLFIHSLAMFEQIDNLGLPISAIIRRVFAIWNHYFFCVESER